LAPQPEQQARSNIDRLLDAAGWHVCDASAANIHAACAAVIRSAHDLATVDTGSSAFSAEGSLFAHLGKHEIFIPTKTWPPMTAGELAAP
jgi:aconitase B